MGKSLGCDDGVSVEKGARAWIVMVEVEGRVDENMGCSDHDVA